MTVAALEPKMEFPPSKADKYLRLYNSDIDWMPHLITLNKRLINKLGQERGSKATRQQISCAILLPFSDPSVITDPPEKLLFGCASFHQFLTRDWENELHTVWKRDEQIAQYRNQALDLGILLPFDYVPMARQAFNWLMERVEMSKILPDTEAYQNAKSKMQNLVYAYGGAVICNTFLKPEYKPKLDKIPNWRTGYFFERLIFEVYKPTEVIRIKEHEINKVDKNLVKKIRTNNE